MTLSLPAGAAGSGGNGTGMKLSVVPIELEQANEAIAAWHRHHQPCVGHRFSLGVVDECGALHAAAVIGRPVARLAGHPSKVLEVTRLVSDGTKNCCSMLYSAAARAGREMGFERIQTYILADEETGASLRASGWSCEGVAGGGQWKHTDGKTRRTDQPVGKKMRWAKELNATRPLLQVVPSVRNATADLFAETAEVIEDAVIVKPKTLALGLGHGKLGVEPTKQPLHASVETDA